MYQSKQSRREEAGKPCSSFKCRVVGYIYFSLGMWKRQLAFSGLLPPEIDADFSDWQMNLSRNKVSIVREVYSGEITGNVSEMLRF